jgi:phosphoribosylformylglycinamidine synthase subunit PurQ / glutaminase
MVRKDDYVQMKEKFIPGTDCTGAKIIAKFKNYHLSVIICHLINLSLPLTPSNTRTMKFGVVVFPGSNCDRDMYDALHDDLQQEVTMLWHKDKDLSAFNTEDCIILPGGFSYGDYLRCGAIARFSPMMQSVIEFANDGGKVFGVCNGFQILCESGLLPGALLRNGHQQFVCKNVFLTNSGGTIYKIPVAHGEGRFYADEKTLDQLEANEQVIFYYCDETGPEMCLV